MTLYRAAFVGAFAFAAICIVTVWYVHDSLAPRDPSGKIVTFLVETGAPLHEVAATLEARGLADALGFEWLARYRRLARELRAGEYELSPALTAEEILLRLTRGEVLTYTLVVPEGLRATEIARLLEAAGLADTDTFLATVYDKELVAELGLEGQSLEGYLFPETYRFARGLSTRQIGITFAEQFLAAWSQIVPQAKATGLSMLEVVTLASIIEKETSQSEERPLIAAVFRNRLRKGMRLETDPSVIYGLSGFDGNLTRSHLEDTNNPYNTYRISGLPPGPISNPGSDALKAVVLPSNSDYLFFVARGDGTHQFSRTYREHSDAVNQFQRRNR